MTITTKQSLPAGSAALAFEQKRILFIEDEDNDVTLVRLAFEKTGLPHELVVIDDSRSAIAYLQRHVRLADYPDFHLPDLVILDLKLAGSSGFDVLIWIASQPELVKIPVVIFSSSWVEEDVQRAHRFGASEYMVKPSGFDGLMEWGREIHTRWLSAGKSTDS